MTLVGATESTSLDDLSRALADLIHVGSPAISRLAKWVLDHPHEMAFNSVRVLAEKANANANTVFRLSVALGFSGFEPCREAFQAALRKEDSIYGSRAAKLRSTEVNGLTEKIRDSAQENLAELLTAQCHERIVKAVEVMLGARRIYCVGVRSCFSLAHYLSYSGHMAFDNFAPPLAEPGAIADAVTGCSPDDVVIPITVSRYSIEVIRAYETAMARGAHVIAISDSYAAPIAHNAEIVFRLPMNGPHMLPSHGAAFALVDAIVGEMILRDGRAAARIEDYERRLTDYGVYS